MKKTKQIAVIGAGWFGLHITLTLKQLGYDVTLFEKNSEILSNISGNFGIRLHSGIHYPRSPETRQTCRDGFHEFHKTYPELLNQHDFSIYGLGDIDANGLASKVNEKTFESVCEEYKEYKEISPKEWGLDHLVVAADINEPSIAVGERLRIRFKKLLEDANVKVVYNFSADKLESKDGKVTIFREHDKFVYDYVINATSFHSLLPKKHPLPFNAQVVYQPCMALVYEDIKPVNALPFSFVAIDGWFPCIMPYDDGEVLEQNNKKYILTHGKWTILASCGSFHEAKKRLQSLDDNFVDQNIRNNCETEINKFFPEFKDRFKFTQWKGTVLAKFKTQGEFRSAVAFARENIVYVFPGKINNIFDMARETVALIEGDSTISDGNYEFVKNGILVKSQNEILEKPDGSVRNTCELQTYDELVKKKSEQNEQESINLQFETTPT